MPQKSVPVSANANSAGRFREAVCIEADRIFDSCSDKDCLEDLQVFFTTEVQAVVDESVLLRPRAAEVLDAYIAVDPVPFNRGFYAVDITFYFRIRFGAYPSPTSEPVEISGLAYHQKRVVLFGGEGSVKTYRSDGTVQPPVTLPVAVVKCAQPLALSCRLAEATDALRETLGIVPDEVTGNFEGDLVYVPAEGSQLALVTLGLFTVVALERSVQIMVPVYDYVVPEKECVTTLATEDPCEMFRRVDFPVEEFFPDRNLTDFT